MEDNLHFLQQNSRTTAAYNIHITIHIEYPLPIIINNNDIVIPVVVYRVGTMKYCFVFGGAHIILWTSVSL